MCVQSLGRTVPWRFATISIQKNFAEWNFGGPHENEIELLTSDKDVNISKPEQVSHLSRQRPSAECPVTTGPGRTVNAAEFT